MDMFATETISSGAPLVGQVGQQLTGSLPHVGDDHLRERLSFSPNSTVSLLSTALLDPSSREALIDICQKDETIGELLSDALREHRDLLIQRGSSRVSVIENIAQIANQEINPEIAAHYGMTTEQLRYALIEELLEQITKEAGSSKQGSYNTCGMGANLNDLSLDLQFDMIRGLFTEGEYIAPNGARLEVVDLNSLDKDLSKDLGISQQVLHQSAFSWAVKQVNSDNLSVRVTDWEKNTWETMDRSTGKVLEASGLFIEQVLLFQKVFGAERNIGFIEESFFNGSKELFLESVKDLIEKTSEDAKIDMHLQLNTKQKESLTKFGYASISALDITAEQLQAIESAKGLGVGLYQFDNEEVHGRHFMAHVGMIEQDGQRLHLFRDSLDQEFRVMTEEQVLQSVRVMECDTNIVNGKCYEVSKDLLDAHMLERVDGVRSNDYIIYSDKAKIMIMQATTPPEELKIRNRDIGKDDDEDEKSNVSGDSPNLKKNEDSTPHFVRGLEEGKKGSDKFGYGIDMPTEGKGKEGDDGFFGTQEEKGLPRWGFSS